MAALHLKPAIGLELVSTTATDPKYMFYSQRKRFALMSMCEYE